MSGDNMKPETISNTEGSQAPLENLKETLPNSSANQLRSADQKENLQQNRRLSKLLSTNEKEMTLIRNFELGFFLFDSTAEKDVVRYASSRMDVKTSTPPLLYMYASMVKLWGRRTSTFQEASEIVQFLFKLKEVRLYTPIEEAHFTALRIFVSRNFDAVVDHYGTFLKECSSDNTVALRMCILAQFFSGNADKIYEVFESTKERNQECATFMCNYAMYGSFSGKLPPSELESIWKEASKKSPDRWTVHHAGAHVLVSRPLNELIDYMETCAQSWPDDLGQAYRSHGFFHLALLYAFAGDTQKAKSLFHSEIWPADHPCRSALLVQTNAIGFLWILHLADPSAVSLQDWEDVAEEVIREELHLDDLGILPLIMAAYCLERSGRKEMALKCVDIMANRSGNPKQTKVGLDLLRGALMHCDGNYEEAIKLLGPNASEEDSECIGASDEQRLPLWYTYISALSQSPDVSKEYLRECIMRQVTRQERGIWPMESNWIDDVEK